MQTIAQVAKAYGLSIREVGDCARKVGVSAQRGAAKLHPGQVEKMRGELEAMRRRTNSLRAMRDADVHYELADHQPEDPKIPDDVIHVECSCCQVRLDCRGDLGQPLCGYCRDHYPMPGEPVERELARLRDHDPRMRAAFVRARSACDEYRSNLRRVTENRDDWREAAIRLVIDHRDDQKGRCDKCRQAFPCEFVRTLASVNRGFVHRAETAAIFSEEELQRHLHPRRRVDSDYFADLDEGELA
jgi:hypothetical protein